MDDKKIKTCPCNIEQEVESLSKQLEEANSAFQYLLKQKEADKEKLEKDILFNINKLIEPYLHKLKNTNLNKTQLEYFNVIESNLKNIVSPFIRRLSSQYFNLTPMEVQIANLIRHGRTTKDIADIMNLSIKTVATHRNNIRCKLGIKNKKVSLQVFLNSFEESNDSHVYDMIQQRK